jgi:signal transduction histidine kinase
MRNNIIKICALFIAILTIIMAIFSVKVIMGNKELNERKYVVDLNEINELTQEAIRNKDANYKKQLEDSIQTLQTKLLNQSKENKKMDFLIYLIVIYIITIIFIISIFVYIYIVIIRPFERLDDFAKEVASGNLDSPLYYERQNLFGAFTWAFDHMRKEVKKARTCEKEAIENNKTVIATISHDIKTPIASIRAYCEALLAFMDSNPERRERYLSVIMNKCDEVTKLTNDLFLHSLSDLDKLQMTFEVCVAKKVILDLLSSIKGDNPNIYIMNDIPEGNVSIDSKRLEQVFENIISNSLKYASKNTNNQDNLNDNRINIHFECINYCICCHIRDYGKGIADEDMPFVFEKFYRGKNIGEKPGAGLGLYIVKYIMEQMDGKVELINHRDGLEVILEIPIVS